MPMALWMFIAVIYARRLQWQQRLSGFCRPLAAATQHHHPLLSDFVIAHYFLLHLNSSVLASFMSHGLSLT